MRYVIFIILGICIVLNSILAVKYIIINEYKWNTTPHDELENSLESFLSPGGTGYAGFVFGAILGLFVFQIVYIDDGSAPDMAFFAIPSLLIPALKLPIMFKWQAYIDELIRTGVWERAESDFKEAKMFASNIQKQIHSSVVIGKEFFFVKNSGLIRKVDDLKQIRVYYYPVTARGNWGWQMWATSDGETGCLLYRFAGLKYEDYNEFVRPVLQDLEKVLPNCKVIME